MPKSPRLLAIAALLALSFAGRAWPASGYGKLSGTVLDAAGTPQMGATIWLNAEAIGGNGAPAQFLTNQNGTFGSPELRPGLYSVRVTLAGFLPTIEQHVRVRSDLTTVVRVQLESVLASLDELRRPPPQPAETDDWKWVLRTASATRPILQWRNGAVVVVNGSEKPREPRLKVEMTTGGSPAGSSYISPNAPATAVSYDQPLGRAGRLLLAGQMNYGQTPDSGMTFGSIWLPSGELGRGPETTVVMRQGQVPLGSEERPIRQLRVEHSEQIALGNKAAIEFGAEFLVAGVQSVSSALRPRGRIVVQVSPHWKAALSVDTEPDAYALHNRGSSLDSALDALDTLPQRVWQNGQAVIAGGWHEELAARRDVGSQSSIEVAVFNDFSRHQAAYGFDATSDCDHISPSCSPWIYAHDGGAGGSWGTRVVYQRKIANAVQLAAIYTWAGALALVPDPNLQLPVEDRLHNMYVHSVAARVSGKLPRLATQLSVSYKWVSGPIVSRQDAYGEATMGMDPNLGVTIRQPLPLPCFRSPGHWEALADFRNILAQGYVSSAGQDGQTVFVPVTRSFRGGLSFQF